MADYISRNNFDALLGESSEALAKEAFQRMDVQLDRSMRTAGALEGWSLRDYQAEYQCVLNSLSDGLEARLIGGDRWYKDNQYLYYEDRIVVPEARLDGCLHWAHLSSGHTGCNRSVDFFRERFYSRLTCVELRARMQSIVDSCACHASKQSDSRDRGLVSSLPIGQPTFGADNPKMALLKAKKTHEEGQVGATWLPMGLYDSHCHQMITQPQPKCP